MMFTYRLGGPEGKYLARDHFSFRNFFFWIALMDSHFTHYFIFRREYEPALLKTGHERVVEIEPRL